MERQEILRANAYIEAYESAEADLVAIQTIHAQIQQWVEKDEHLMANNSLFLRINYCNCLYACDQHDYNKAFDLVKQTASLKYTEEDYLYIAKFFRLFCRMTMDKGGYEQAIVIALKGMEYAKAARSSREQIRLLNFMGISHSYCGRIDLQLHYFNQMLALARETGDRVHERLAYNNLAYSYLVNGNYDVCREYLNQAEVLYMQAELDANRLAFMLTKVALLHHEKEYVEAELLLARIQYHPKLEEDKALYLDWYLEMANHYIFTGQKSLARRQLETGLQLAIQYDMDSYQLEFMQALILLLEDLGVSDDVTKLKEAMNSIEKRIHDKQAENESLIEALDLGNMI